MKLYRKIAILSIAAVLSACGSNPKPSSVTPSSETNSITSKDSNSDSSSISSSENKPSSQSSSSISSSVISSSSYSNKVTITVTNGTGSGQYKIGDPVTIDCIVPEGYEFEAWKEGENVFARTKQYSFIASRDITLTASFTEIKKTFDTPSAFKTYLYSILNNFYKTTTSATLTVNDNKVENEYTIQQMDSKIEFYKDAFVMNFTQKNLSKPTPETLNYYMVAAIKDNNLYRIQKFEGEEYKSSSRAAKTPIVENPNSSDEEISIEAANQYITKTPTSTIFTAFEENFVDGKIEISTTHKENYDEITLEKTEIEGNFYIVRKFIASINTSKDEIKALQANNDYYVKSTSLDSVGNLKEDAKTAKDEEIKYEFTTGTKANLDTTKYDLNSYFISSFDVTMDYYDNNAHRYFNKDFLYLPLNASISIYDIEIDEDSVLPKTACEQLKIAKIESSDESVVKFEKNKLTTLKAGKAKLIFYTTQGAKCEYNVEVKALAPYKIELNIEETVEVNKRIELSAEVSPSTASSELNWTVDDASKARIVSEDNKTYLEGIAKGNVVVTATSKLDSKVSANKTVIVTEGVQSTDNLATALCGVWEYHPYSNNTTTRFKITFSNDGTFTFDDNYRAEYSCFTGEGTYNLTNTLDTEVSHTGTYVKNNENFYYIEVTSYRLTGTSASKYYVKMHFAIKNDGSKLLIHVQSNADQSKVATANTLQYEAIKVN